MVSALKQQLPVKSRSNWTVRKPLNSPFSAKWTIQAKYRGRNWTKEREKPEEKGMEGPWNSGEYQLKLGKGPSVKNRHKNLNSEREP